MATNLEDKQRFREAVSCFDRFPAKTTRYIKCKFNIQQNKEKKEDEIPGIFTTEW